jgi:hypothetical protein
VTKRDGGIIHMTRCALCRTMIASTSPRRVDGDKTYHLGCWDRKVRQEVEKKKPTQ